MTKFKGLLEATKIHRPGPEEEGFLRWCRQDAAAHPASAVILTSSRSRPISAKTRTTP
jgi:hypothetical protein